MSYHYVCVNFLRVPRTEVNEKICVNDYLVKFSYRPSSICTIRTATTYRHLNERVDMEGFNERLKQLHASIAQFDGVVGMRLRTTNNSRVHFAT